MNFREHTGDGRDCVPPSRIACRSTLPKFGVQGVGWVGGWGGVGWSGGDWILISHMVAPIYRGEEQHRRGVVQSIFSLSPWTSLRVGVTRGALFLMSEVPL